MLSIVMHIGNIMPIDERLTKVKNCNKVLNFSFSFDFFHFCNFLVNGHMVSSMNNDQCLDHLLRTVFKINI